MIEEKRNEEKRNEEKRNEEKRKDGKRNSGNAAAGYSRRNHLPNILAPTEPRKNFDPFYK